MRKPILTAIVTAILLTISFSAQAAFIINGDGTVTDTATGLMWKRTTEPVRMNWDTAMVFCDNLSVAGYADWYLPPIDQLQTLIRQGASPTIDTSAFPNTAGTYYWSSSSSVYDSSYAWAVSFHYGNVGPSYKTNSDYYARAVRSGQSGSLGHLVISTPAQGARWLIGTEATITWDPQNLGGEVRIGISRDGGKTFEAIAANAPNTGSYTWAVTGPEAFSCAVRIEPLADPTKTATQGFFTICEFTNAAVSAVKDASLDRFILTLNGLFTDGPLALTTAWTSLDTAVATVQDNVLTGLQNGWANVSATYQGRQFTKAFPVYKTLQALEMESNNTEAQATAITAGTFYKASFYSGDIDYYTFTLADARLADLGYLSTSTTADMRIEVFDAGGTLLARGDSADGQVRVLSLGLAAGTYRVKVSAYGDVDQTNYYVLTYRIGAALPSRPVTNLALGTPAQSRLYHNQDHQAFAVTLAQRQGYALTFTPAGDFGSYHIELLDSGGNLVDQNDCLNSRQVAIQRVLDPGLYTVRITPAGTVDAANPFSLTMAAAGQVEAETNDSFANATAFDLAQPISGRLNPSADTDLYRFDLATPRFLLLKFNVPYSAKNFAVYLYKESEANLIDGIAFQGGGNVSLNMGLGVGRYYLKVVGDGASTDTVSNYTLTLTDSAQANLEIESNNTIKFANALEKDSPKKGRVYSAGDKDYFGFYLPQTAIFTVTFAPATITGDYTVSLVDENDQIFDQRTSSNGQAHTIEAYKYAGNYFVRVESAGDIDQYSPYELTLGSSAAITGLKQLVSVTVAGANAQMTTGTGQQLTATASYSDATSQAISSPLWSSLNTAVATVDAAGNVQAVAQGTTSIVASHGGLSGKFDITVGAPTITFAQHHGNLIVVAGGGAATDNTLWPSTNYLSDLVYLRFKNRLFTDTDIHYFNPVAWHDIDGDGYDNAIIDDTSPTVAELGTAITGWAAAQSTDGPLYIYLIDHGGLDSFLVFPGQILTAQTLKGWLDSFQSATGRKVVVMIEACKSGSFTDDLAATNRIIVTATGTGDAYQQLNGRVSFTQFFIDRLLTGDSVQAAYTKAMQNLANMGLPYNQMNPQLTGATLAATTRIGGDFAVAGLFPEITGKTPDGSIVANANVTFWAQLADLAGIETVWAVVVPPNYIAPPPSADLQSPQVALPTVTLADPDKNGVYEAGYSDFAYSGNYRVTFYAKNATGNVTVSAPTTIAVTGGISTDTDGDGMPDSWEDSYAGLNKTVNDAAGDLDNDTLTNLQEYQHNTSPTSTDTDGDTMPDGWEVSHNLDPTRNDGAEDADGDGVTNLTEYTDNTDPQSNTSYVVHTAGISGRVVTTVPGYPVSVKNAVVTLQGTAASVTTTQDGTFSLANVPLGTYTLKITATNFVQHSGQVTLTSSGLALGDITLTLATTTGVAGDASGNGTLGMEDAIWILQVITGTR